MKDEALAEAGAMKPPAVQDPSRRYTLRYKLAWRWHAARSWIHYVVVGRHQGMPVLVNLLVGNGFVRAIQVRTELAALGHLLADLRPENALEIGTARGGTLFLLTRLASLQATIVSVDLPLGTFGGGYGTIRKLVYQGFARSRQRLHLLRQDSHSEGTLCLVKKAFEGRLLDYLFIDGDHSYDGVKKDFEMYAPLVRKGGFIAFHDIVEGHPDLVGGVPQFWRELKPQFRHVEIINDPLQGGYGIGVLFI